MASIAYDVALILPQARIPADGIFGNDNGAARARELETALGKRWTVEFQIADFPRADGTHNIPFFSKLTLREEARDIEAMEFDVSVRFIKLTRVTQTPPKTKKAV